MTGAEFETILADETKTIVGDLSWLADEDHSPAVEFRAEVASSAGWPLFVRASYNPLAQTLTYALILQTIGRVYALDIGKDHHNPTCEQIGETHKHLWTDQFKDKQAYAPTDITATVADLGAVWTQFCAEARITHRGVMNPPPPPDLELFL